MAVDTYLRQYQTEAQQEIFAAWDGGTKSVMLQMPTGAGKTRLFVNLIASRPAHYLIVTHREELVEQISETLTLHYHLEHGILQGKNTRDLEMDIIVSSIQSWTKNTLVLPDFDCIIIDEAHHSLAESYRELWKTYPKARKLGVTATPYRLKKATFMDLYDVLLESWPMRQMIEEGYLASYRLFSVSESRTSVRKINRLTKFGADGDYKIKDLQEIVVLAEEIDFLYECYAQNAQGRRGIIYAVNREHAQQIAERFAKGGIVAVSIDSKTKSKERKQRIEEFRQGKSQILVNVELFTEGFDCPSVEFVMLARPTRSLAMYMQQIGQALRPTATGEQVLILDCAGLHHRFGRPDRKRDWQKHFKGERASTEQYEKRSLGEQERFSLLHEIKREMSKFLPKPEREILPSDTGIHIYRDNNSELYGICDEEGNVIEKALYDEIHRTPYGWYQGLYKEYGCYFPVIFNKQGEECLICTSLKKVEYNVYEAMWNNRAIRFNLHLKIIPQETLTTNGITVYQISHNTTSLYAAGLELGGIMTTKQMPWGDDYVLLNNGMHQWNGLLVDRSGMAHELSNSNGTISIDGVKYVLLRDGRMIGNNGTIRKYQYTT